MKDEERIREVVFRGKRLDNGAWETGSLVRVRMGCSDEQVFIADKMTGYHTPVDPTTVGQYTGVKAESGTEIWEGDIITGLFQFGMSVRYIVTFKDGSFGLSWTWNGVERFTAFTSVCNVEYTVIGSIHDDCCDHDCEACEQRAVCNASTYTTQFLSTENPDQKGICPVCGGEIEYGDNIQMDDGGVYQWTCPSCGASGEEGYDEVFDGHHYNVVDVNGKKIQGREEGEKW